MAHRTLRFPALGALLVSLVALTCAAPLAPLTTAGEPDGLAQEAPTTQPGKNADEKPTTRPKPTSRPASRPSEEKRPKAHGTAARVETEPAIPYAFGEWLTYHWIRDGEKIATSNLRFEAIDGEPDRVLLSRTFEYRVSGRRVRMQDQAELNRELHPIETSEEHQTQVNDMQGSTLVEAEFEPGIALVTFQTPGGQVDEPRLLEIDLDGPVYLYPKYSFLAELSMIFHEKGAGTYALFCPYEARAYRSTVKKVRAETIDGKKLTRWHIQHKTFGADFWLDEKGRLEKYRQQGEEYTTEVVRVR